jgi:hypothetical protein
MSGHDLIWRAGRLVQWALKSLARPAQEPEYQELVEQYLDNPAFRSMVRELVDGLGLDLLDVSMHGIVLAPQDNSVFALKPSDFRTGSAKTDDRLLDGLAQVAIAATVFPRARDLDDDPDIVRSPVTVDEVDEQLRRLCEGLAEQARQLPDPDASDEKRGLIEAWRVYLQRVDAMDTRDARRAPRATRRVIEFSLERLREFGCFTCISSNGEPAWQPTRRYQILVQQLAATKLFQIVREAIERPGQGDAIVCQSS